jgi:hypothetical protein
MARGSLRCFVALYLHRYAANLVRDTQTSDDRSKSARMRMRGAVSAGERLGFAAESLRGRDRWNGAGPRIRALACSS